MPSSLQYPLERERDLQRRWSRLLRRTLPPHGHVPRPHPEPNAPFGNSHERMPSTPQPLKRAHFV